MPIKMIRFEPIRPVTDLDIIRIGYQQQRYSVWVDGEHAVDFSIHTRHVGTHSPWLLLEKMREFAMNDLMSEERSFDDMLILACGYDWYLTVKENELLKRRYILLYREWKWVRKVCTDTFKWANLNDLHIHAWMLEAFVDVGFTYGEEQYEKSHHSHIT